MKNKIILAVSAHEDDLEFGCSGTIAKWVKEGAKAYYLILTDGSKGNENRNLTDIEIKQIREKEQIEASKIIGVEKVFFGNFTDGELKDSDDVRRKIVRVIREIKPDIVIGMNPNVIFNEEFGFINHPDHIEAGKATLFSVYPFSRNMHSFPELLKEGLEPYKVKELLLIAFSREGINEFIDITDTVDIKIKALEKHISQYDDFDSLKKNILDRSSFIGKEKGYKYAEAFIKIKINQ